ncbi:MAG: Holliday junction resolvase RuvX [Flavobacteriaceae bacterium]
MGRIVALDYGRIRTGIAVTDELHIIASGLRTVKTTELLDFLKEFREQESIDRFVIGEPRQMNSEHSESEPLIKSFIERLKKSFPGIPVERQDERFTSKIAHRSLIDSGLGKKRRQNKELIDEVSAVLILQAHLDKAKK